jgi:acyl transferase domain-containing protein/NADPH:quinone reductase-like Zn-dependent oxidoreductase/nucleoside-diphosphate-sugar epimerase
VSTDLTNLSRLSAIKLALLARDLRGRSGESQALQLEPLAIVGMGCRFPGGADDPASYWRMLAAGTDAVREVPADRWDWQRFFDPNPASPGKISTRWGGFIDAVDTFDASFFGISPREALHLDPQQRLFLEVAYEALEDAGLVRKQLAGSRTGVFVASYHNDYAQRIYAAQPLIGAHTVTGASHSVLANRLSYLLDLHGPSLSVDTACSSSLVALHLAARSLRQGECDAALAAGVSLMLTPELSIALSKWGFLAEDGRCKTFDVRANGFVRGEGCGAVVLKRLSDALTDGDPVLALLRGTAINQDGRTNVLTAPSGLAQQAVVREALADGAIAPDDISYVEAHGTGTALGDPIELEALAAVFGERPAARRVMLGSAKTNIGHLEAAAGIAGVIKVVMAMRARAVAPHLHFTAPNPHFDLAASPFRIPTTLEPWTAGDGPRRAGVSSFGFGGTNAHIVLEEAPALPVEADEALPPFLLALSAHTPAALNATAARYAALLRGPNAPSATDVCFSATRLRDMLDHRMVVVGASTQELAASLDANVRGEAVPTSSTGKVGAGARPAVVFVFSGQGPQWWAMGRELLDAHPAFAEAVARCDEAMRPHAAWRLLDELRADEAASRLHRTEIAQPALFALQTGLVALWREWGGVPAAVVGHSVGEIAAAHAAGVLDLATAARLAVTRGRIMQAATGLGRMAAIETDAGEAEQIVAASAGRLSVAAVNGPRSTVLSGDAQALDQATSALGARGIGHTMLPVDYAFHSAVMEPYAAELEQALSALRPAAAKVPFFSTVTGARCAGEALNASYWRRNLRDTVRFAPAVQAAGREGMRLFLEIGPHPVLGRDIEGTMAPFGGTTVACSLRRQRPERATMLAALGLLHTRGMPVEWDAVQPEGRRVSLPGICWQRTRHWLDIPADATLPVPAADVHPLLGAQLDSPAVAGRVFESRVQASSPAFLDDHRVAGMPLLPGTAFVETALAAAHDTWGDRPVCAETLEFHDALRLTDGPRRLQWIGDASSPDSFEIFSRTVGTKGAPWIRHASGRLTALDLPAPRHEAPHEVRARCTDALDAPSLYARFAGLGLDFGPAFRGIERAWFNDQEALAEIAMPDALHGMSGFAHWRLHPAMLDACLQPCTALLQRDRALDTAGEVFLPVAIGAVSRWAGFGARAWTHVRLRPADGDGRVRVADIDVCSDDGAAIVTLRGLRLQRVRLAALGAEASGSLYREAWAGTPLSDTALPLSDTRWLVCVDAASVNAAALAKVLAQDLGSRGARCEVLASTVLADDLPPRLAAAAAEHGAPLAGVVLLCSESTPGDMAQAAGRVATEALGAMQALLRSSAPATPLWVVTRGARAAVPGQAVDASQALSWGLARAAELEHPELRCRRIDLDPLAPADEATPLLEEFSRPNDTERETAWRHGQRLAPRLARCAPRDVPTPASWRLEATRPGSLEGLARRPAGRRAPSAGEIEIEVRAAGLNFRDVLAALGMYPGATGPAGGECAGVVSRVGPGVSELAVGDEVMAFAGGSFASHVVVRAPHATRRPDSLSMAQAAATPIAFLTAMFALQRLARLRVGERVLIHAAAGGVGLAAVQVAQRLGAEVFATAGSPAKRHLLTRLGVRHVMDSRSLDFAAHIHAATGGEGVHVVLNALSGDFIAASVAALARGGRFVEMGKREIWTAQRMHEERPDAAYFPFDLGVEGDADATLIPGLFAELVAHLADGSLRPLPLAAHAVDEADEAFRTMAQARHVGKLVLVVPAPQAEVHAHASYLVTGGHGALGLHVAKWLVDRGARHLVLAGRHAPSLDAVRTLDALRGRGVAVRSVQANVADGAALAALLDEIDASGVPLRGVVHAAGVLDDGVLLEQTPQRMQRVIEPKLLAAWHLHRLTCTRTMDFFVLFSAGAAVLGSPGQAGYCAANLALDAMAAARCAQGLPAVSIAWGPWADGGMAAALSERDARRWLERGVLPLSTRDALHLLDTALDGEDAAVAALAVDWPRLALGHAAPTRFERVNGGVAATAPAASAGASLHARMAAVPRTERRHTLDAFLREQVRMALGLGPDIAIDDHRPLRELGLDSLMSVELRNALVAAAAQPLPATLLFDYPTLDALTVHLARVLDIDAGDEPQGVASASARQAAGAAEQAKTIVAALSDDEAEALLLAELGDSPMEKTR